MRYIRLLVVSFVMLSTLLSANAQRYLDTQIRRPDDYKQKIRLGIRAGINLSDLTSAKGLDVWNGLAFYNINQEYIGFTDTRSKFGFNAGVTAQIRLINNWWLQTSLMWTTKGYKIESQDIDIDVNAHYVQLPVDILYKFPAKELDLIASIGAFLGVGMYGYTDFEDHYGENSTPREFHQDNRGPYINEELGTTNLIGCDYTVHGANVFWKDRDDTFLSDGTYRIDGGIELGLGMEYKHFQFMFNYQFSLTYLYNYAHSFKDRYDFKAQQGNDNYQGFENSFEYFNLDIPTCPRQHVLSFTITYFFDNWKHGLKI